MIFANSNRLSRIIGRNASDGTHLYDNRFKFCFDNDPGSIYYSSAPIKRTNGVMVEPFFEKRKDAYVHLGTDSVTTIYSDYIEIKNERCAIGISFWQENKYRVSSSGCLVSDEVVIYPSLNGITVKQNYDFNDKKRNAIVIQHFGNICCEKYNTKYFALMETRSKPFWTFSVMYSQSRSEDAFYGANIIPIKTGANKYTINLLCIEREEAIVTYEINLYEEKIIQDTTVESKRRDENNVYGSTAIIGKSQSQGTQILYSRIDFNKIDPEDKRDINCIELYLPIYMATDNDFEIYAPTRRFCTFGSTWKNKIPMKTTNVKGVMRNDWLILDLTEILVDSNGGIRENNGFVLKYSPDKYAIVGTGDGYNKTQILKIQKEGKTNEQ